MHAKLDGNAADFHPQSKPLRVGGVFSVLQHTDVTVAVFAICALLLCVDNVVPCSLVHCWNFCKEHYIQILPPRFN